MKADNACIPCILNQAYNAARRATDDNETIRRILDETAAYLQTLDLNVTPAEASNRAYEITRDLTGGADPYAVEKKQSNDFLLERVEDLWELCMAADDPLKASIRLAIMGNIIDYGSDYKFDLESSIETVFTDEFHIDDYRDFRRKVVRGENDILFIGDNAGEIVMDMIVVERLLDLGQRVVYVVRGGPVINDATREDAEYIGMDQMVKVIDTGSDCVGINWKRVSDEFMDNYRSADIVISKGQGNYETLSDIEDKPVLYLLKAKCELVAKEAGVGYGDIICRFKEQSR